MANKIETIRSSVLAFAQNKSTIVFLIVPISMNEIVYDRGWHCRTKSAEERTKTAMNFQSLVYSILGANENQRVLNDLYGQIERDQSSRRGGTQFTPALYVIRMLQFVFAWTKLQKLSGFSTFRVFNSADRRERAAPPRDPVKRTDGSIDPIASLSISAVTFSRWKLATRLL